MFKFFKKTLYKYFKDSIDIKEKSIGNKSTSKVFDVKTLDVSAKIRE